jgi:hypothetical protein
MIVRGVNAEVLNLSSFDFYGFSQDDTVRAAARAALEKYGCGSCGPRGFYGTIDQHLKIEDAVARFMGTEEAISYSDGASTVSSTIPAFAKKGDLLLVCCRWPTFSVVPPPRRNIVLTAFSVCCVCRWTKRCPSPSAWGSGCPAGPCSTSNTTTWRYTHTHAHMSLASPFLDRLVLAFLDRTSKQS